MTEPLFEARELPLQRDHLVRRSALVVAGIYCLAYVTVVPIVVLFGLYGTDRLHSADWVRALLFPFGDVTIYLQAIVQAAAGYVLTADGPVFVGAIPVAIIGLAVSILHVAIVALLASLIVVIARLIRKRGVIDDRRAPDPR